MVLPIFTFLTHRLRQNAFTLSELLIAIAILGLISTFTIPKVLQLVNGRSQQLTNTKETVAAIQDITLNFYNQYPAPDPNTLGTVLTQKLQAKTGCTPPGSASACGLTLVVPEDYENSADSVGFVMHNGQIVQYKPLYHGLQLDLITIDINGVSPPNCSSGCASDSVRDVIIFGVPRANNFVQWSTNFRQAGLLTPFPFGTVNTSLYKEIYGK